MSRQIVVTVQYKNNKTVSYGVFNGKNADYVSSQLNSEGLKRKIDTMKKEVSGKKYKQLLVKSITSSAIHWSDHSEKNITITGLKNFSDIDPEALVKINNLQHIATKS